MIILILFIVKKYKYLETNHFYFVIMTLSNINYKGCIAENLDTLQFSYKPKQCVLKYPNFTIIIFPNVKCKIMGCKKPLETKDLPMKKLLKEFNR